MPGSNSARFFIALVTLAGLGVLVQAGVHASWDDPARLSAFAVVACLAARLKVKLPGLTGNMSVNLPFILVAVAQMPVSQALMVACLSTIVQCLPRAGRKFNGIQAIFNFSNMALAVWTTRTVYDSAAIKAVVGTPSLLLAVATAGFFLVNSVPVAVILSLTESKNVVKTWVGMFQLSFPYFVASAGIAGVVITVTAQIGWMLPLAVLPLMFAIFHSYRRYFSTAQSALDAGLEVKRPAASVQAAS